MNWWHRVDSGESRPDESTLMDSLEDLRVNLMQD
jgi:hypothetical protein